MKQRIDQYLVLTGKVNSRTKAQTFIEQGLVSVNGNIINKSSFLVSEIDQIIVNTSFDRYVSRGGYKLEKAIDEFKLNFEGKQVLDIGASTGGFTDCALQHGAAFVYALDVGTAQLHTNLLKHPQVKSIEKTNFRYATQEDLDYKTFDFIVTDVSFIPLRLIFQNIQSFLHNGSEIVVLIKPQFELDQSALNKHGIVRRKQDQVRAIELVVQAAKEQSLILSHLTFSPVQGEKEGNIEFLAHFLTDKHREFPVSCYNLVVDAAHQYFHKAVKYNDSTNHD